MVSNGSYSVREKYIYKKFQQSYLENEMVSYTRERERGSYRFATKDTNTSHEMSWFYQYKVFFLGGEGYSRVEGEGQSSKKMCYVV